MHSKPLSAAPLTGGDGNTFAVMARASLALKRAGYRDEAAEMQNRVFGAHSYDEALSIIQEYVEDETDENHARCHVDFLDVVEESALDDME